MYVILRNLQNSIVYICVSIASAVSFSPPDLRIVTRPLHTRLSLSSAGMPVDDLVNIDVIRNDWVQMKARQEVQASEKVNIRFVSSHITPPRIWSCDLNSVAEFAWVHLM